jgi:hypothetical protein
MTGKNFRKNDNTMAGSAMIYVLIAIVLFVALALTVTKSTRTGKMSLEDALLQAQNITSYADKINGAVQNVMLQNSCLASQINFANSTIAGYTNAGAPVNKKCDIFDPAGGGMIYQAPPTAALDTVAAAASAFPAGAMVGQYLFHGKTCVTKMGTGATSACAGDATDNEELLLIMPWVTATVCTAINQVLEIPGNTVATIPTDNTGSFDETKFTGSFTEGKAIGTATWDPPNPAGCFQSTAAGSSPGLGYHFYYILLAR